MKFENKIVWITGASSGIGKHLALTLSKIDCKLILSSRRKLELDHVKSLCKDPKLVHVLPMDLEDIDTMKALVETAVSIFGKIDILVNNGGISQRSLILETDVSVDRKLMEVDYLGTVALSKAILPHFVSNQAGHFVVVSSVMGKFSSSYRSAYCGAKHALHGFFDALRLEHDKDDIKVTMICPGFVNTEIAKNALTADGSTQKHQDQKTEDGLEVNHFVKRMIKAVKKEKFEAYIGKREILGVFIKRLSPKLAHWLVLRSQVR